MHTMNGVLAEHDKMRGHKENSILSSIYILLFPSTLDDILSNQLNTKHYNSTRLDSTSTTYLICPVTQCTCVLHHKANIRQGASALSLIADKTQLLHDKLRIKA